MAQLEELIQEKIDGLIDLAYEKHQEGNVSKSFELLKKAWSLYPEPKKDWTEAYNTAKYLFEDYMEIEEYDEAKKWLNEMIENNNNLNHSYEDCLFNIGKYKFCVHQYEEALSHFKKVVKDAGYRYFEDEDPKYLDFYKHPDKYIKQ
jgi:tetratricopeptide (TPR) repeat protein